MCDMWCVTDAIRLQAVAEGDFMSSKDVVTEMQGVEVWYVKHDAYYTRDGECFVCVLLWICVYIVLKHQESWHKWLHEF